MARRKPRRTQWIDAIINVSVVQIGGPTISSHVIVSEAEIENLGGAATITRVVGSINVRSILLDTIFSAMIWVNSSFVGAGLPIVLDADIFQRSRNMWSDYKWQAVGDDTYKREVDIRTQRKLGQGVDVLLTVENANVVGNTLEFVYHLRMLLLLG